MKKKTDLTSLKQGQQNKLNALSNVVPVISSYLTEAEIIELVTSNHTFYGKLQPNLFLTFLLKHVVTGNQDRVIKILSRYPQLMVIQGRVTDNSGRIFKKVSAAELVRWCGDLRYMANAMLDILKELSKKTPEEEVLAEKIRADWVALDDAYDLNGGLEFLLPGSTEPKKSLAFSLAPLLKELQAYIDNFMTWEQWEATWEQRKAKWCTKVGAEQRLLTAYYLQNYCNPAVPFCPTPSFDAPTFPRSLEIYNYNTGDSYNIGARQGVWDRVDNGGVLGRDFGICSGRRGGGAMGVSGSTTEVRVLAGRDLVALRACEERTALDLLAFKAKLREPLNQQPVAEQQPSH